MSNRVRWLVAVLIVALAAAVALWPRGGDDAGPPVADRAPDLTAARLRAALAPCPPEDLLAGSSINAVPAVPAGLAALSGTRVECLANGRVVDLAVTLSARPVLVNVWATWCQPCREELPVLAAYAAEPGTVRVVGLAVQSAPADALELLAALRVRLGQLWDPAGAAQRALKVPDALPATYLIASDGTVHFVNDPRLFRSVDQVRQTVARYLPPDGSNGP
jgi:thiol-disulfide isomerase/thioredoxin